MGATFKQNEIKLRESLNKLDCIKPVPDDIVVSNTILIPGPSTTLTNAVVMEMADYSALTEYDSNTLYVVLP